MVGRARELDELREAFARAVRDRSCVLATILGVAGRREVAPDSGVPRGSPGRRPSSSAADASPTAKASRTGRSWRSSPPLAGVLDADGPGEIRSKIDALLGGTDDAAIASDRLAEFLGLAGATASPEETHWAIRKLFEALAAERPLVAVFDDIHWAEPGLLDLIEHVAEWTRDAPILLLVPGAPGPAGRPAGLGRRRPPPRRSTSNRSPRTNPTELIVGLLGRRIIPRP